MSTVVTYNGVTIPYPKTQDISDEPVYQDGDYLYTKWTFRIAGVVYAGSPAYPAGTSAAQTFDTIEHYLSQPRKRLTYTISGVTILDVAASAATTGTGDVANGPFAELLSVARVDGGQVMHIEFRVTAHVRMCPGQTPPSYLSNRWMEVAYIDDEQKTTRTRVGEIVLRSDFNEAPDSFRGICTPPIPTGFMRQTSRYALQKDGLRIQYEFVDVETYMMPPLGTVKAAAKYREICPNGATRFGEVSVSVVGNFRANRKDLLIRAISVAVQRLERAGLAKSDGRWKATGAFEEDLYEPKVMVQLRAMIRPPRGANDGGGVAATPGRGFNGNGLLIGGGAGLVFGGPIGAAAGGAFGGFFGGPGAAPVPNLAANPLAGGRLQADFHPVDGLNIPGKPSLVGWGEVPWGSESGLAPDPGIRGTAGLALLAAALNDPCLTQTVLNLGLSSQGDFGQPILIPQNTDPGASKGGGAGAPTTPPDPFFNPGAFIGGGR